MSRLLCRPLTLAATGVALAAPSLILSPTDIIRRDSSAFARGARDDVSPFDALFMAGHMAPGMIGLASAPLEPGPNFIAAGANGSGTSAAMPSGWAVGDLLIIFGTTHKAGTTCAGHNTPTGWAELGSWTGYYGAQEYLTRGKVFWRIAQSGDSTVTLTRPSGENAYNSCMMAFRGVDAASPFEAMATLNNQSAASSIPYARISTLGADRMVVQVITSWATSGAVSSTPGVGWTERFDRNGSIGLAIDTRTFASAGLTPAGNQTRSGSWPWGRIAFAIKPAPV